eukprot:gene10207-biopygen11517
MFLDADGDGGAGRPVRGRAPPRPERDGVHAGEPRPRRPRVGDVGDALELGEGRVPVPPGRQPVEPRAAPRRRQHPASDERVHSDPARAPSRQCWGIRGRGSRRPVKSVSKDHGCRSGTCGMIEADPGRSMRPCAPWRGSARNGRGRTRNSFGP